MNTSEQVREYYDQMTPLYLEFVGQTFQAGLLKGLARESAVQGTIEFVSDRAGIRPGHRILDAGCGVCGPAMQIARLFDGAVIDAITLSPAQAKVAETLVAQSGLTDRVSVQVGDYHDLPYDAGRFDTVLFLESMGYCHELPRLLAEVQRVLKPGGTLYIKDIFCREAELTPDESSDLNEFNRVYRQKTPRISMILEEAGRKGFHDIRARDLTPLLGTRWFDDAMRAPRPPGDEAVGERPLSEFGVHHYRTFRSLPLRWGDIRCRKA
jgi:cyclopropane fatty-acyl-phospholipid synthase-like methyltransferase